MHLILCFNRAMTRKQCIAQYNYWTAKAAELADAYFKRINSGAASATLSSGGGSKSYTNWSNADFERAISRAKDNAAKWRAKAAGGFTGCGRMVQVVRR